jgi:hypothetical protein
VVRRAGRRPNCHYKRGCVMALAERSPACFYRAVLLGPIFRLAPVSAKILPG